MMTAASRPRLSESDSGPLEATHVPQEFARGEEAKANDAPCRTSRRKASTRPAICPSVSRRPHPTGWGTSDIFFSRRTDETF
jgi:hypothetical protein